MTRFVVTVQAYCRHAGAASSTAYRRLAARLGAVQGGMGRPLNPFSPTYTSLAGRAERSEAQRKTFGFPGRGPAQPDLHKRRRRNRAHGPHRGEAAPVLGAGAEALQGRDVVPGRVSLVLRESVAGPRSEERRVG